MLTGFVYFIGTLAALAMIVIIGDYLIGHVIDWHDARRRNRLARKYGFVEWKRSRS